MLPKGKELGEKIRAALRRAGIDNGKVAEHFGIRRQAVNGWFSTGRISKEKLLEVVRLTAGHVPPGYWQDEEVVQLARGKVVRYPPRSERRPPWPFTTNEEKVCRLPDELLAAIDAQLAYLADKHLTPEPRRRARQT